jgi:hypothetical protein
VSALIRHRQTIFANPDDPDALIGNCLQAAVASLVGLPLDKVPHFAQVDADGGKHYGSHVREFLAEHGWQLLTDVDPDPGELHLALGKSPRGRSLYHVAIYRDGALVHDPHPDDTGIAEVTRMWVLRRVEP